MDHLLSSSGGEHILVPYVGVEEYDRGDFNTYWQRKGWRTTERGHLIFKDRTPYEKAAFFQTWLHHGHWRESLLCVERDIRLPLDHHTYLGTQPDPEGSSAPSGLVP